MGAPFDVCPQACSPESLPTEKQDTGDKKMELYRIKLHQRKEIHKKEQFYNKDSESSWKIQKDAETGEKVFDIL